MLQYLCFLPVIFLKLLKHRLSFLFISFGSLYNVNHQFWVSISMVFQSHIFCFSRQRRKPLSLSYGRKSWCRCLWNRRLSLGSFDARRAWLCPAPEAKMADYPTGDNLRSGYSAYETWTRGTSKSMATLTRNSAETNVRIFREPSSYWCPLLQTNLSAIYSLSTL